MNRSAHNPRSAKYRREKKYHASDLFEVNIYLVFFKWLISVYVLAIYSGPLIFFRSVIFILR